MASLPPNAKWGNWQVWEHLCLRGVLWTCGQDHCMGLFFLDLRTRTLSSVDWWLHCYGPLGSCHLPLPGLWAIFFHPKRNKSGVWLTGIHQKTEDRRNSSHILDFNFLRGTSERQDDERSGREICLIPIRYGEEAGLFNKEWEGQGGWRVGGSQKECGHWLVVGSWSNCRRMSPCRDTRWNPHCPHFP